MPVLPDVWVAQAALELRERERRQALVGPYLVLPPLDPPLVPPDDESLIEREAPPVESAAASTEGLRVAMAQFRAGQR